MQIEVEEQQMRKLWSLNKAEILGVMGLVVLLMTLGAMPAAADTVSTIYCTGGNTCFTSTAGLTSYWTLTSDINLTSSSTFTYALTVSATNETNAGFLQDFSGQYFFNGSQLTNLTWVQNPGGWVDLSASKAGNSGSCQGNTPGAFCGAVDQGGTTVALSTTPVTFSITGDYTGTFLDSNGNFNFQAAASLNSDGTGGNVFAISQSVAGGTVPDGGATLMLLGGALVGIETLRRKFRV
jgi:hypothetical protein